MELSQIEASTQISLDTRGDLVTLGIIPNKRTHLLLKSDRKYRMTHQRQVILEEVMKDGGHPTADEIYESVLGSAALLLLNLKNEPGITTQSA